jgi:hypothetical protein
MGIQRSAILAVGALIAGSGCRSGREPERMRAFPDRVLWAWESPQDLRFLAHGEGVAFLAGELALEGGESRWMPRRNPLQVNPGTPLMAVVRVETRKAALGADQHRALVERALQVAAWPGVKALQIDFDATESERGFYLSVLRDLRGRLPEPIPISITALASWCLQDRWMRDTGLARVVDEAVPMLFRMGGEADRVRKELGHADIPEPLAGRCYGLSTDEIRPRLRSGRRCYVFHPGPWRPEDWERIRQELR